MGKSTGFMDYPREDSVKESVNKRIQHNEEFETLLSERRIETQAARCMDCGIPFCNWGCPVENLIPEFNEYVYHHQWKAAYGTLQSTNNFPEFTGRICPAPCEPACCAAIPEKPITIKQIELGIIEKAFEKGWVKPNKPAKKIGKSIAIIGSGPAGLAAAQQLNLAGYDVTVYEKNERIGGLLTFGIPDFKLEKHIVERRVNLLKKEGIVFKTNHHIGVDISIEDLQKKYDAICLCCGAEKPRDLDIPGREKKGIHFAMDFLTQQNRRIAGTKINEKEVIDAKEKHVVVVGGGDTGSDCVGTSIRQGCKSVTQLQIHKTPPKDRYSSNPWPNWPKTYMTSSSQEEGCKRTFAALSKTAIGKDKIEELSIVHLKWPEGEIKSGQRNYEVIKNSEENIPCDLLLISLGFLHTFHKGLVQDLNLQLDSRGNILVNNFETSQKNIFAAGDMIEGANLVVTAISSGRKMAKAVDIAMKGFTNLS